MSTFLNEMSTLLNELSDLLGDPDFMVEFEVTRVTVTEITAGLQAGEVTRTHGPRLGMAGVIYPASPESLEVLPEGLRGNRAIQVFTHFVLQHGSTTGGPGDVCDYVHHDGVIFKVAHVKDWTAYGFRQVTAVQAKDADLGALV